MKDSDKTLRLMRFWLFGTFIIVFAAVTSFAAVTGTGLAIMGQLNYWIIIGVTAVACVGIYFGYQAWLNNQKK